MALTEGQLRTLINQGLKPAAALTDFAAAQDKERAEAASRAAAPVVPPPAPAMVVRTKNFTGPSITPVTPTQEAADAFLASDSAKRARERGIAVGVKVDPEEYARLEGKRSKSGMGLGNTFKKLASVATNTLSGFAAGGNVGAIAGLARGVVKNTKTGEAETINLRTAGQAAVTGGVANIAAGVIAKGAAAIAGAGAGAGGGAAGGLKAAIGKVTAFGKSGGLVGNAGKLISGAGKLLSAGIPALAALGKSGGVVPGTDETVPVVLGEQTSIADKVRNTYRNIKPQLEGSEGLIKKVGDLTQKFRKSQGGDANPSTPIIVPAPTPASAPVIVGGGDGGGFPLPALAAVGAIAFLFLKKK